MHLEGYGKKRTWPKFRRHRHILEEVRKTTNISLKVVFRSTAVNDRTVLTSEKAPHIDKTATV
jgi:hypothetical protein